MKRSLRTIILFAALLASPSFVFAEDIGLNKAKEVAEMFFAKSGQALTRSGSTLTLVNSAEVSATRAGSAPALYIFNRAEGGFVIVSGSDAAMPILGYSFENSFGDINDMPENLSNWLDFYRGQINERRASGIRTTEAELARWKEALVLTRADGAPKTVDLQTPDFGQGKPFNTYCPLDTLGKKTIVGCVATAISEIVAYYKYPAAGSGTLPAYTTKGIKVPERPLGHAYKWDKILPKYSGVSYTDEQSEAVATLCYDIAVMIKASFGSSATSGYTNRASYLADYMGYSKGMIKEGRSYSTAEEWKALLKNSIDASKPVLFSGSNASAGHAFVIDGYDSSDRFLINFGWNASSNGFYQIDAFGSYTKSQTAYLGVNPDDGLDYQENLVLVATTQNGISYTGLAYNSGKMSPGQTVNIYFGAVQNNGTKTATNIVMNIAYCNKNGEIKGWCLDSDFTKSSLNSGTYTWWNSTKALKIPKGITIERGDYLEAFYKSDRVHEWTRFGYSKASDTKMVGRMPCHIEEFSTFEYDKKTDVVTIRTFAPTTSTWDIYDSNNESVKTQSGARNSVGRITFTRSNLPSGKYRLVSKSGEQTLELEIIL